MSSPAYDSCSDDELVTTMGQLHALESATRRELCRVIAAYDKREAWRDDGARSMPEWLVARFGMEHRNAVELARTAAALEQLPALSATLADGRIGWDQIVACRPMANADTDEELAKQAPGMTAAELRRRARCHRHITDEEASRIHKRRSLGMWWSENGETLHIRARLAAAAGAVVENALMRLADEAPRDPETNQYEDLDARLADALVSLAATRLAADADADRATVVIQVERDTIDLRQGVGETDAGGVVAIQALEALLCDCKVEWSIEERGNTLGVGRKTRTVPRWLFRQLKRRDGGCRFPGCGRTRWLHAHHIVLWSDGGRTDLDNLLLLCSFHHHALHRMHLRIEGNPGGDIEFIRPDGWRAPTPAPPSILQSMKDLLTEWLPPIAFPNTS